MHMVFLVALLAANLVFAELSVARSVAILDRSSECLMS